MERTEVARMGGQATKRRHGVTQCPLCNHPIGSRYYNRIGATGAAVMHTNHSSEEKSKWGKRGGRGNRKCR